MAAFDWHAERGGLETLARLDRAPQDDVIDLLAALGDPVVPDAREAEPRAQREAPEVPRLDDGAESGLCELLLHPRERRGDDRTAEPAPDERRRAGRRPPGGGAASGPVGRGARPRPAAARARQAVGQTVGGAARAVCRRPRPAIAPGAEGGPVSGRAPSTAGWRPTPRLGRRPGLGEAPPLAPPR